MRNPDRLDNFYNELKEIHKTYCPDWRFGQFIINIFSEMEIDPFFPEEDEMIKIFRKYFEKE